MINSMTGYATLSFSVGKNKFSLDIKSYNHRYLDIYVKGPRFISSFENVIKRELSKCLERGKVEVYLTILDMPVTDEINEDKAKEVYDFLKKFSKKIGLERQPELADLFILRDLFFRANDGFVINKKFETTFLKNFNICLKSFLASRKSEGDFLKSDILQRLQNITYLVKNIEKNLPQIKERNKAKIASRVNEILTLSLQKERLEQEISYMLDKLDVSEELSRLKAHLKNVQKIIDGKAACGKKLDFYCQEMQREINTLSVKSQDALISELSIDVKAEIEKIREQVQNVE